MPDDQSLVVLQIIHPTPYLHRTKGLEGSFPIQLAPPAGTSPACPWKPSAFKRASKRLMGLAAQEGEWVSTRVPTIPGMRIVDRDVILLGMAELWLTRALTNPGSYPWINAREEGVSYIAVHPAKQRLMSYAMQPFSAGPTWPDHAGHKIFLDRIRKLARGGYLQFLPEEGSWPASVPLPTSAGKVYLVGLTELGMARALHIRSRLRAYPAVIKRLNDRLAGLGIQDDVQP